MATDLSRKTAEGLLSALPLPDGEAGWARDVRAAARTRLLDAGAPVKRDEYWRFTDPARLTVPLAPVEATSGAPGPDDDAFAGIDAVTAAFVNGRFRPDLSDPLAQDGLAVGQLAEVTAQDISVAREVFGVLEAAGQEKVSRPLAMLNTASAREGLVLQATGTVARPLYLRHSQIGEGAAMLRHVIRVESGASLTILESGTPSNAVIEVDVAAGGTFHHLRVQTGERAPSATHLFAQIGEGAVFKSFTLMADGALTRNETVMDLVGDGAVAHVAGAVLGRADAHLDNTVFVTHSALSGESRQVFKNVLTEKATAVFQGKIFVRQVAQQTDGYQISQSVVLDDGAEFLVKPELEIYADDVKCSHGSTTGALDPDGLFYLRARGVPQTEAERMLVEAFADEAIEEIDDGDLADLMRAHVSRWMAARGA
ncbi:MAG: SufD family Fe-S cluster assembly protein [Pseudomonadota bacterium]